MKMRPILWMLFALLLICQANPLQAQNQSQDRGQLSGDLQINARFYDKDTIRGASGIPFYEYLKYGADSWLNLNYKVKGFDMGVRFDGFYNSAIFDPTVPLNGQGIGRWYIKKSIDKLTMTGGYFYDQYGSGMIFRAYENRPLGIDQAVLGINLKYDINDNWRAKAFTGTQKNIFDTYGTILRGANLEGYVPVNDDVSLSPGIAFVNRILNNELMLGSIVPEIRSYPVDLRFNPKYNVNLVSLYNTLNVKNVSWYTELVYKSEDVIRNNEGLLINPNNGIIFYNTLTYSRPKFGIVVQGRYMKNFDFRSSPLATFNRGLVNYVPSLTLQNSYRLVARYNAVAQFLGEFGTQAELTYTIKRGLKILGNFSHIRSLDGDKLFQEIQLQTSIKPKGKDWKSIVGLQMVDYNRQVFEQKGDFVHTLTPFIDFTYKFSRKKSLKTELSYMLTKRNYRLGGKEDPNPDKPQDLGDWFWVLAEYNVAPKWSVSVVDMLNVEDPTLKKPVHYPTLSATYAEKITRFTLSYGKNPAGIVCTGGVCRFEPAFSGVQMRMTTNF